MISLEHFGSEETPEEIWYKKAELKAKEFIGSISPTLEVVAAIRKMKKFDEKTFNLKWCLVFTDAAKEISWSMDIEENDEYIDSKLEEVVKRSYKECEEDNL